MRDPDTVRTKNEEALVEGLRKEGGNAIASAGGSEDAITAHKEKSTSGLWKVLLRIRSSQCLV